MEAGHHLFQCAVMLLRLQAAERAKEQAQNSSVTNPEAVADAWRGEFAFSPQKKNATLLGSHQPL